MKYAQSTGVSVIQSRAEIETIVVRYGATKFASMYEEGKAVVLFEANNRKVAFELKLPNKGDLAFLAQRSRTSTGRERGTFDEKLYEQACRQRWRALALVIKAKLEAVESEISTFDSEFLAHIVLANGKTVGSEIIPQIVAGYSTSRVPLLGAGAL